MKLNVKIYSIISVLIFVVFNVALLLSVTAYSKEFWACFGLIDLAFVICIGTGVSSFKSNKADKLFLSIPVGYVSVIGLVLMMIAGLTFTLVSSLPSFAGVIICFVILALTAVSVIATSTATEIIGKKEEQIKAQTQFIKMLTVDANTLVSSANDETKASAIKVYEAIRYSDPMSSDALMGIESQIQTKFAEFSNAVADNDLDLTKALEKDLLVLIENRNNKCKMIK